MDDWITDPYTQLPAPDFISVTTFASAAPKWAHGFPDGPKYTHFVHMRDATPSLLGVGAFGDYVTVGKKRAGLGAEMVFIDGEPGEAFTRIDENEADTPFRSLRPLSYHGIEDIYFPAYAQLIGTWSH